MLFWSRTGLLWLDCLVFSVPPKVACLDAPPKIPERFSEVAKNVRVSDPLNGLLYFRKFEKKKVGGY
jgi:hypothetical protein